jgi:hypothetical protein
MAAGTENPRKGNGMTGPLEQVASVFRENDWEFDYQEDGQILHSGIESGNGRWQIVVTDVDDGTTFIMLSVFPQKCPPRRRLACAELITRVNWGLTNGFFEMDAESGRIHFKTLLPFSDGVADTERLQNAILGNLASMNRFLPIGMSVIYANTSPKQALAAALRAQKSTRKHDDHNGRQERSPCSRFMNN